VSSKTENRIHKWIVFVFFFFFRIEIINQSEFTPLSKLDVWFDKEIYLSDYLSELLLEQIIAWTWTLDVLCYSEPYYFIIYTWYVLQRCMYMKIHFFFIFFFVERESRAHVYAPAFFISLPRENKTKPSEV